MIKRLLGIAVCFIQLLGTTWVTAQDPVDCVNAIVVCDNQQLNYNSNGPGIDDFGPGPNNNSNGCLMSGEHQSAWFQIYISPSSPPGATLSFTLTPSGGAGQDYDFALYGPNVPCENLGNPIRCSFAAGNCGFCPETGIGMGTTDFSEGVGGDGFVADVVTQPGESYLLLIDNWSSSNQGFFLDWTGTALLSCSCSTVPVITGNNEICPGETSVLTATGTNLTNYTWTASAGGTISGPTNGSSINATSAGTYTVSVTDADGCSGSASYVVTTSSGPNINYVVDPSSCGLSNGSIDLTISGSPSPYTYDWSTNATTQDLINIPAGSYSVTVEDANGCTATATIVVTDENLPLNVSGVVINNTSCTQPNGSITVTVNPPGTYNYIWSNGASTSTISNLNPGTYSLTVTSSGSCTGTATFTVNDAAVDPVITSNVTPSVCELANGAINVSVSGGVAPYTYSWSGGETSEDLSNIPPGSYSITVTGANGCTATTNITVTNNNPNITVTGVVTPNTSCNTPNGSITVTINPATSPSGQPYTFSWSNGQTVQNLTNLSAGSYSIVVNAGGSCGGSAAFTIVDQPDVPDINATITAEECGGSDGSIVLNISGGQSPFTYIWSDGSTGSGINNLPAGNYSVTVTGSNGCTAEESFTVTNDQIIFTVTPTIQPNTSCSIDHNGSISIIVNPPGNYDYAWSNGENTQNIFDLAPGNYTVTVTAGLCEQQFDFVVPDAPVLPTFTIASNSAVCDEANGSATITMTGGQGPYTFEWSNGANTQNIQNVSPGNYSVTVTGANECEAVGNVTIGNSQINITATATITPNTSCLDGNGAINLNVTPASGLTFEWSNGAVTQNINNLSAGSYSVTISAGGSCENTFTYNVTDAIVTPLINLTATSATCGQSNGSVNLTMNTGTPPYTYDWSSGDSAEDLMNIEAGTYSVTVTDALGCTSSATITVNDNTVPIVIMGEVTANTSCDFPNGAIDISVSPAGSYEYAWSSGEDSEDLFAIDPGTYTVTVSLGNCTGTSTFTVDDNISAPVVEADMTPAICGEANGAINLTITGGVPPYAFDWSTGENSEDITDLLPGTYAVTVTGANDCSTSLEVSVTNNSSSFTISGNESPITSCLQANGMIDLIIDPPGAYEFLWSNGETSEDLTDLTAGNYSVTVTLAGSCSGSATFSIENETSVPSFNADLTFDECDMGIGSISLNGLQGDAPFTFLWSNGETGSGINNLTAGTYSITVTDINGCSATSNYSISSTTIDIDLYGVTTPNTACTNPNGSIDIDVTPAGNYNYQWSNGSTTEDLTGLISGNYTVTVSLSGSCNATATYTVANESNAPEYDAEVTADTCGQGVGSIEIVNIVGTAPFGIQWSSGENTQIISGLTADAYTVTITDASGCSSSENYSVPTTDIDINISQSSQPNTSCNNPNGSIDINVSPAGQYVFQWSTGSTSEDLSGLTSGNYTVTVSLGSCSATTTVFVGADASAISLNSEVANVTCNGIDDGFIHLETSGGSAPFTYTWDPFVAGSIEDLDNLGAGVYTVTVTDQAGCSMTSSFTISEPAAIDLSCSQSQSVSVPGGSDGIAAIQIAGGIPPYSIAWTPGSSQTGVAPGIFNINNLSEGNYTVVITDANGCTAECSLTITSEDCITSTGTMDPESIVVCGEGCATALYDATGEVLNTNDIIQFILHTGSGQQIQYEIARSDQPSFCLDDSSMEYNVQYYISAVAGVNDGNGNVLLSSPCAKISAGTPVIFHEIPVASIDDPDVIDCDNPEVALTGHSTIAASTFLWTTKSGSILGDPGQSSIIVNQAGLYELVVTALTCKDTAGVQVSSSDDYPSLTIIPPDDLNCVDTEVTLIGSVQQPDVVLQWAVISNQDTTILGVSTSLIVNAPGVYYLLGTATNGCMSSTSVTVNQFNNIPTVDAGSDLTLDCNQAPLTIQANASVNVDYLWSSLSGVILPVIDQSAIIVDEPGRYVIMVTDNTSFCTATDTVEVFQNNKAPVSEVTIQHISCFGESDGIINVQPTQGTGPFIITVNGESNVPNGLLPSLSAGLYEIEVEDAGGCKWNTQVEIIEPPQLVVDLGVDLSVQPGESVTIEAVSNILPGAIESIIWEPDQLNNCPGDLCTSIVHPFLTSTQIGVTLIDTNGCIAQDQLSINVVDERNVFVPNAFSPNDDGINDVLFISGNADQIRSIRSFAIYNRWGNEMYEATNFAPNDPLMGWDGTFRELKVNPGVFVYRAEIEFMNGDVEVIAGDVTVVK